MKKLFSFVVAVMLCFVSGANAQFLEILSDNQKNVFYAGLNAGPDSPIQKQTMHLSNSEFLDFLSRASGYFLADTIRAVSLYHENNTIYDRIRNHCCQDINNGSLWVQGEGEQTAYGFDENSVLKHKDIAYAITAGYDKYFEKSKSMLGIYGRYKDINVDGGDKNAADINSGGLGLYGGIIKNSWEIKALINGSFDTFMTKRQIPFNSYAGLSGLGEIAKAQFNGISLGADIEGALKFDVPGNVKLRPFVGLDAKNTMYESFNEAGTYGFDLCVENGNYFRSAARAGLGAIYNDEKWNVYVNGTAKYLLDGKQPQIQATFKNETYKFSSRGYEEDGLILEAAFGCAVKVYKQWELFVNANYADADKFSGFYGNLGIRYNFCKCDSTGSADKSFAKDKKAEEEALAAAKKAEEKAAKQAEELKKAEEEAKAAAKQAEEEALAAAEKAEEEAAKQAEELKKAQEEAAAKQEEINKATDEVLEREAQEALKRREKPTIKSFKVDMANFEVGKTELLPASKEKIKNYAEEIKKFEYNKITVEGHTDSTGSKEINKVVSNKRAKAVYDEFVKNGIPAEKMQYIGFAEKMPVDTNKTAEGRAKNRRVEIFVE